MNRRYGVGRRGEHRRSEGTIIAQCAAAVTDSVHATALRLRVTGTWRTTAAADMFRADSLPSLRLPCANCTSIASARPSGENRRP